MQSRGSSRYTPRLRLLFDLLGENVAFRTYQFSVDTTAGNFADALGNAHITLHQCVQIFCLEDQEARAGQCSHVGRTACAPQHGDLAEEMAHSEPRTLVRQFDLDLAGGDEIHRVARLAAAHDHRAGLDLLGPQQPHDVGDFIGGKTRKQRDPRHHSPSDNEVAAVNFLGEGIGHDADGERDHD